MPGKWSSRGWMRVALGSRCDFRTVTNQSIRADRRVAAVGGLATTTFHAYDRLRPHAPFHAAMSQLPALNGSLAVHAGDAEPQPAPHKRVPARSPMHVPTRRLWDEEETQDGRSTQHSPRTSGTSARASAWSRGTSRLGSAGDGAGGRVVATPIRRPATATYTASKGTEPQHQPWGRVGREVGWPAAPKRSEVVHPGGTSIWAASSEMEPGWMRRSPTSMTMSDDDAARHVSAAFSVTMSSYQSGGGGAGAVQSRSTTSRPPATASTLRKFSPRGRDRTPIRAIVSPRAGRGVSRQQMRKALVFERHNQANRGELVATVPLSLSFASPAGASTASALLGLLQRSWPDASRSQQLNMVIKVLRTC